jgi:hypothetical protein
MGVIRVEREFPGPTRVVAPVAAVDVLIERTAGRGHGSARAAVDLEPPGTERRKPAREAQATPRALLDRLLWQATVRLLAGDRRVGVVEPGDRGQVAAFDDDHRKWLIKGQMPRRVSRQIGRRVVDAGGRPDKRHAARADASPPAALDPVAVRPASDTRPHPAGGRTGCLARRRGSRPGNRRVERRADLEGPVLDVLGDRLDRPLAGHRVVRPDLDVEVLGHPAQRVGRAGRGFVARRIEQHHLPTVAVVRRPQRDAQYLCVCAGDIYRVLEARARDAALTPVGNAGAGDVAAIPERGLPLGQRPRRLVRRRRLHAGGRNQPQRYHERHERPNSVSAVQPAALPCFAIRHFDLGSVARQRGGSAPVSAGPVSPH